MIRREFKTTDGAASWLLISQIEHARISGLLARHWSIADFWSDGGEPAPDMIRAEVLSAITHHDDGWTQWEQNPPLDPVRKRPYSFMNELLLDESLAIWDASITAARNIGPLAGWMVASHFYELLENGNHMNDERAVRWLKSVDERRDRWLHEWQRESARCTESLSQNRRGLVPLSADGSGIGSKFVAERALRLLQACDFLSLWLCCECPVAADEAVKDLIPFELQMPTTTHEFSAQRHASEGQPSNDANRNSGWRVTVVPWPFDDNALHLAADAWQAPIRQYDSTQELLLARRPTQLQWWLH